MPASEIFRGVIVEFAMRDDFSGNGSLGIVIAEHGDFDFAGADGLFHENFHGEFGGQSNRWRQFFVRMHLGHAHGRAERGGFHEQGIRKLLFNCGLNGGGVGFPLVTMHGNPGDHGNFRTLQQALGHVFVHADRGAQDAGTDERQSREVQQSLDRCRLRQTCRELPGRRHPVVGRPRCHRGARGLHPVGSAFIITRWPWRKTSGSIFCAPAPVSQWPSLEMPMGTGSYLSGSRPRITEAAEASETSCSPERPPKRMPTRRRFLSGVTSIIFSEKFARLKRRGACGFQKRDSVCSRRAFGHDAPTGFFCRGRRGLALRLITPCGCVRR